MAFDDLRERMVQEQLRARGIADERVLGAFLRVPRHEFVPPDLQSQAYADRPLPIGNGQTISQPYIVALMLTCLRLQGHERVLEIGAGSGYQTALLSELGLEIFSIERLPDLMCDVSERLARLGFENVQVSTGNGTLGWPEHAPFDAIIVSAAAPQVPAPLVKQLGDGGRMVLPVGPQDGQMLVAIEKRGERLLRSDVAPCVFVPLIGEHGWEAA